jgi:hypothetical protein
MPVLGLAFRRIGNFHLDFRSPHLPWGKSAGAPQQAPRVGWSCLRPSDQLHWQPVVSETQAHLMEQDWPD